MTYGEPAGRVGEFKIDGWDEFMRYMYLPVRMHGTKTGYSYNSRPFIQLPERLHFARPLVETVCNIVDFSRGPDYVPYIYLTAKHGFATPENPLNRPGWHCDGFGTDDLNFVWMDRWGSLVAEQEFTGISPDHQSSMKQFESQIQYLNVHSLETETLHMLSPFVVHTTPEVPPPGGMRRFIKISVSDYPYNLLGNSHNYLFDYKWKMYDRAETRNDPIYPEADFVREML